MLQIPEDRFPHDVAHFKLRQARGWEKKLNNRQLLIFGMILSGQNEAWIYSCKQWDWETKYFNFRNDPKFLDR